MLLDDARSDTVALLVEANDNPVVAGRGVRAVSNAGIERNQLKNGCIDYQALIDCEGRQAGAVGRAASAGRITDAIAHCRCRHRRQQRRNSEQSIRRVDNIGRRIGADGRREPWRPSRDTAGRRILAAIENAGESCQRASAGRRQDILR